MTRLSRYALALAALLSAAVARLGGRGLDYGPED